MIARFATWAWLVIVFLALMESVTFGALLGGAVLAGVLMVIIRPEEPIGGHVDVRPLALLHYAAYFAYKLVQANLHVAWAVIAPSKAGLRRGIIEVPVAPAPQTVLSLLAMSVSLTPGTSIIDTRQDPPVLYIHVLQVHSVEQVRMDVLNLERRLIRALASAEALADVDRRLADLARQVAERPGKGVHR